MKSSSRNLRLKITCGACLILTTLRTARYIASVKQARFTPPLFREGNGRCQLTLLDLLLTVSGFGMHEDQIDPEIFVRAMIASLHRDTVPLVRTIRMMMD